VISMSLIDKENHDTIHVDHFPFVIGRSADCDLELPYSFVSRAHAAILLEGKQFVIEDTKSRHGTFVNGRRVARHVLRSKDKMQFGSVDGPRLVFDEDRSESQTIVEQIHEIGVQRSDLERLRWFLNAAQQLNAAGAVEGVLSSLLEATLALAKVECGYVFLKDADGVLKLALGMDASGSLLEETGTVSRTVMRQASEGNDQFIVTDSLTAQGDVPESILASTIRTIICIPLRRSRQNEVVVDPIHQDVFGALYLESRFQPERVSEMDHDLLRTIAREAAALVDNAQLAAKADEARQQEKELQIAAAIQQGLMRVQIPAFSFAEVSAHSIACSAVGGDFFDVIASDNVLNVALVDVSGKGIAAAILASTLQGMLFVQLQAGQPLDAIASATNQYLCDKNVGKYATMLLLRLAADGRLEYINCGHIQLRLCFGQEVHRLQMGNLPVGLIPDSHYTADSIRLDQGSRLVLVSDGFTEAEDAEGNCFGEDGLDLAVLDPTLHGIRARLAEFCSGHPANDDQTVVQVVFRGVAISGESGAM
jgi:sigma-B regulation protein RsbU (phosphoserine phosphatase)